MKTGVILAGGKSERFGGVNALPKPAVQIGETPMVLHAAGALVRAGCRHVIVLTGANHDRLQQALGLSDNEGMLTVGDGATVPFTLRFSGEATGTGGRLLYVSAEEFAPGVLISYTDVFSDFDPATLSDLQVQKGVTLVMLAVNPRQPWGELEFDGDRVSGFREKPVLRGTWINGGIFAAGPELQDAIHAPSDSLEQ
ncbi:sugar phosphate nucleotidyltransferase [Yoonia sp. BS5-3]|uniref:NDP-sugar synthase n=1 Tax=Yoonia phaeophyticola TaxID=3137369 RepID=A0ABZ2V765_9RHOB